MVEINTVVTDIAASAHEQATGLDQVNSAVNQMDQVTQKNAAMVEETTAAAHGLAGETEELGRLVARYKIRQAEDDPLRAELKKAAPHAFREASKTGASSATARAPARPGSPSGGESRRQRLGTAGRSGREQRLARVLTWGARRTGFARFAAPLGLPECNTVRVRT